VKPRVLIVDGHALIRRMLRTQLEAEGVVVQEAENGAVGVQKAQGSNPGLVILDLSMPVMNGLEAARALQIAMPQIPLLMFTTHSGVVMEKEARAAGIATCCRASHYGPCDTSRPGPVLHGSTRRNVPPALPYRRLSNLPDGNQSIHPFAICLPQQ
jgi:two-component system chemotaxis response regulator CheY